MIKTRSFAYAVAAVALGGVAALAQPPQGRGGPGGPGGPGGRSPAHPVVDAIDANGDRVISAAEIANASAALKSLDKNGDGQLDDADLARGQRGPGNRPQARGGDRGQQGRGQGQRGDGQGQRGDRPERERGDDRPSARSSDRGNGADVSNALMERLRSFDENKDGEIAKSDLPERMGSIFDRHDSNDDGVIDANELGKIKSATAGAGNRGPAGRGGPGGPPPSPERFVEQAMEFDADGDGKLSLAELKKFAEEMPGPRGGGPPREGGRPQRGR